MSDSVNHPSHYTSYSGLEVHDLTKNFGFDEGNAIKYILRAGLKGDKEKEHEDLNKAIWYIKSAERNKPYRIMNKSDSFECVRLIDVLKNQISGNRHKALVYLWDRQYAKAIAYLKSELIS